MYKSANAAITDFLCIWLCLIHFQSMTILPETMMAVDFTPAVQVSHTTVAYKKVMVPNFLQVSGSNPTRCMKFSCLGHAAELKITYDTYLTSVSWLIWSWFVAIHRWDDGALFLPFLFGDIPSKESEEFSKEYLAYYFHLTATRTIWTRVYNWTKNDIRRLEFILRSHHFHVSCKL